MNNNAMLCGFILAQCALITMYLIALRANPATQLQLGYHVFVAFSLTFVFIVLGFSLPRTHRDVLYKVLVPSQILLSVPFFGQFIRPHFNELLGPYLFSHATQPVADMPWQLTVIPLNIHAFQSRLCLFIMMVTGEGMIQIISPTLPESSQFYGRIVGFNFSCFVILFGNAMLYADAVLKEDTALHVMTRSPRVAGECSAEQSRGEEMGYSQCCYAYAYSGFMLVMSYAYFSVLTYMYSFIHLFIFYPQCIYCIHCLSGTGLVWIWMHVVTGYFIYLIGISIEIAIHDVYLNEPILHAHDTIMGVSCGCITLCLNLMRSTHKGICLFIFTH
jgi:hypothetical protein